MSAVGLAPADFPHSEYAQAAAQGKPVYQIDPARSLLTVIVRRGGPLARMGHDHVVASHGVRGYVSTQASRADMFIRLNELTVDEPVLRAKAGLDTQPSESDIAGTRTNMLDRVIDAKAFPFAVIHVSSIKKVGTEVLLETSITLHGVTREFEVPVKIKTAPESMSVMGFFEINQTDFGIVPLSILGGALQVQDRLGLHFSIYAGIASQLDPSASRATH